MAPTTPTPPQPHTYHYHNFLSPNAVYVKLYLNPITPQRCYHQHGHFYVGSTGIGIPHREHNRRAKLKQLQNIPISAELSLRYWHSHNNIHRFTPIQLSSHETYDQAWIQEHHLISNWMPPLNWPFISQHLKLKAQGWQFTKSRAHFYSRLATHKRLFRKLRRRQRTIREPHLFTSTRLHALTLLRNLTKHTLASFEAAKQLRSGKHTDPEVYAIRRMASNLEEPGRSRALHIINKALQYRNLTPPKPNIPLTIPFLAHNEFTKHCEQWLLTTIQQHKHLAIPLHLPTHRLREAAHNFKTLRTHLHNHRTWEATLQTPPDSSDLPCACSHLKTILLDPATPTVDNHYILTLEQLMLPPHLRILIAANMNSTFYPSKARYFLMFQTVFAKWLRIQGLPASLTQHLEPFLQHQWKLHTAHLKHQPRFTARLLRRLQEFLGDQVVLHHADHELQQLRIFCPRQYFTGALATWQAPELFEPMPTLHLSNIHEYLLNTVPSSLRTRYKWGFCKDFTIPYGIVHLKEKKHWRKGRTIISYFQSLSGNLLRITSRAVDIILQHLLPQLPGQMSIPQLWAHFHCYLTQTPPDIPLDPCHQRRSRGLLQLSSPTPFD